MYAIVLNDAIDRYPLTLPQVRLAFPDVSFAATPDPQALLALGVVAVQTVAAPAYDPDTQQLLEGPPAPHAGGWVQTWTVTDLTADEIAARLAARRAGMGVTPRQARLALQQAGLLGAVTSWIAAADEATRIEWEFALEVRRDWPPITACAQALGLTESQLDGLFALAATL